MEGGTVDVFEDKGSDAQVALHPPHAISQPSSRQGITLQSKADSDVGNDGQPLIGT